MGACVSELPTRNTQDIFLLRPFLVGSVGRNNTVQRDRELRSSAVSSGAGRPAGSFPATISSVTFYFSNYFPLHFGPPVFLFFSMFCFFFFSYGGRKAYGYFFRCRVIGGPSGLPSSWRARRMRSQCSVGSPLRCPFGRDWTGCCPRWLHAGTRCWGREVGLGHSLSPLLSSTSAPPNPPCRRTLPPPAHPSAAFKAQDQPLCS